MILLANKLKIIDSGTYSGAGSRNIEVGLEQAGVILTLYVSSIAGGATLDVALYDIGYEANDKIYITSFSQVSAAGEVIQVAARSGGNLRLEITHTGTVTYSIRGKALGYHLT